MALRTIGPSEYRDVTHAKIHAAGITSDCVPDRLFVPKGMFGYTNWSNGLKIPHVFFEKTLPAAGSLLLFT